MKWPLTVKHMQTSLSRIEREYVLLNLTEQRPPLSLLIRHILYSIPEKTYTIVNGAIAIDGLTSVFREALPVRVFFQHKKRGLVFQSTLIPVSGSEVSIEIDGDINKDNPEAGSDISGKLTIHLQDKTHETVSLSAFPLDLILVDPAVCLGKGDVIDKLSAKVGLNNPGTLLAYRLFEYLDGLLTGVRSTGSNPHSGHFFFIDHEYILVSVQALNLQTVAAGTAARLAISYGKRHISVNAEIHGLVPVNANLTVVCLAIKEIQEEDKRFLFEKLYRQKYQK